MHNLFRVHKTEIDLPLIFVNIPENLVLIDSNITEIPVILEGTGFHLAKLMLFNKHNAFFEINAKNYIYWNNLVQIHSNDLVLPNPDNYTVHKIKIDQNVLVKLDKIMTKEVSVTLKFSSEEDESFFKQNKVLLSNPNVKLEGPESVVKEFYEISTPELSRNQLRESGLNIRLQPPHELVSVSPSEIDLNLEETILVTRTLSLIPVNYPFKDNIIVIPPKVTVQIQAQDDLIQDLDISSINAFLTEHDVSEPGLVDVRFSLPPGVTIIDHTPQKIQVIINE